MFKLIPPLTWVILQDNFLKLKLTDQPQATSSSFNLKAQAPG